MKQLFTKYCLLLLGLCFFCASPNLIAQDDLDDLLDDMEEETIKTDYVTAAFKSSISTTVSPEFFPV